VQGNQFAQFLRAPSRIDPVKRPAIAQPPHLAGDGIARAACLADSDDPIPRLGEQAGYGGLADAEGVAEGSGRGHARPPQCGEQLIQRDDLGVHD